MELFEEIRREYEHGPGTVKGVARKLGVHRRLVREALADAIPKAKRKPERPHPALGPLIEFIDGILAADRKAPRKQRHTAHRIYGRIREEMPGHAVSESSVRRYVSKRKPEMGGTSRETFVPQAYAWGVEAQVDWYEAYADLGGERRKMQVFSMRSMASGGAFHRVYLRSTQQAFLEAHEEAFAYFGGVFRQLRYDNLASAVKKILRGHRREETARFIAFRSHWGFASEFCTPGAGHEKGGVEGDAFLSPSRGGAGIHLPWDRVNEQLCGLQPADLMILAGRPSHGKTAAALQIAYTAAKTTGVVIFSLEMSRVALSRRMVSMIGRVDSQRMRRGDLDADERRRAHATVNHFSNLPITIFERGDYTTSAIRRALKSTRGKQDIGLVIVDHLHLVKSTGSEDERIRFSRIMDDFQRFAKPAEFNIPFLVLAQLNRKCEEDNREPQMSDLAETGKIEQNADIVVFTHRPEMYGRNRARPELHGVAKFIIGKQRNGPCGGIDMVFDHKYQTFEQVNAAGRTDTAMLRTR